MWLNWASSNALPMQVDVLGDLVEHLDDGPDGLPPLGEDIVEGDVGSDLQYELAFRDLPGSLPVGPPIDRERAIRGPADVKTQAFLDHQLAT